MRTELVRFRALSPAERRVLVSAWCWLLVARVIVRCGPLRSGLALVAGSWAAPGSGRARPTLAVERVVGLVEAAARHHPLTPTCLEKALVTVRLLRDFGAGVELVLGVMRSERFAAHAWLEKQGRVMAPGKLDDAYEPLLRLDLGAP